jgi:hypothetical protein
MGDLPVRALITSNDDFAGQQEIDPDNVEIGRPTLSSQRMDLPLGAQSHDTFPLLHLFGVYAEIVKLAWRTEVVVWLVIDLTSAKVASMPALVSI